MPERKAQVKMTNWWLFVMALIAMFFVVVDVAP